MKKLVQHLPTIIGLSLILWFNNSILPFQGNILLLTLCHAGMLVGAWLLARRIILYSRERHGRQKRSTRQIWFVLWLASLTLLHLFFLYLGDLLGLWRGFFASADAHINDFNIPIFVFLYVINFVFFLVLGFIDEWAFSREQQRKYEQQIEKLEYENLQTQLDLLKSQINPHFLFNSLNTLSELVMDNPQAEAFVDKLASVYRYLLQSNLDVLCPLENELKFIKAYFHLLETRHGRSVKMEFAIGPEFLKWQLPPLTLQLLVENAVKHNAVSEASPLVIRLFTEGENLVVENNVQRKTITVPSNKVGLSNIAKKYQLLGGKQVEVVSDERRFRVVLPLISPMAGK
jgi:hypothetical protein